MRFFAVRGPRTSEGLHLSSRIALGDPALLLPYLIPLSAAPHGRTVAMPHCSRLTAMTASQRRIQTGCDEVLSPMVLRSPGDKTFWRTSFKDLFGLLKSQTCYGTRTHNLWGVLGRIAGAGFVLTGSLHGAILSQAFGVPWAAYHDGYMDAPAKWTDWAAYLGIDIKLVRTLKDGRDWWQEHGSHGHIRDLMPLLESFPYGPHNPVKWRLREKGMRGGGKRLHYGLDENCQGGYLFQDIMKRPPVILDTYG